MAITDRIESMYNHTGEAYAMLEEKGGNVLNPLGHNLPDEYQEVDYIESHKAEYINTNYVLNSKSKITIEYIKDTTGDENTQWIFGQRVASNNNALGLNYWTNENPACKYSSSNVIVSKQFKSNKAIVEIDLSTKTINFIQDGETITKTATGDINTTLPLYIFACNQNNQVFGLSQIKLISFKVEEENNLILNLIPSINKNNVAGMYDLVTGTFFGNAGTGAFTYGTEIPKYLDKNLENLSQAISTIDTHTEELEDMRAEMQKPTLNVFSNVMSETAYSEFKDALKDYSSAFYKYMEHNSDEVIGTDSVQVQNALSTNALNVSIKGNNVQEKILPEGYTQVDYIESHGNEYINTMISNQPITNVLMKFKNKSKNENKGFFGRYSNSNSTFQALYLYDTDKFSFKWKDKLYRYDYNDGINQIKIGKDGIEFNSEKSSHTSSQISDSYNILIFARREEDGSYSNNSSIELYAFEMFGEDKSIFKGIPCFRNSDNVVGLYDLVSNTFFENAGTGAFTYGSVVSLPNPDFPQKIKTLKEGKIVVNGNDYLSSMAMDTFSNGVSFKTENGKLVYKGTSTANIRINTPFKNSFTLEAGEYVLKASDSLGITQEAYFYIVNKDSREVVSLPIFKSTIKEFSLNYNPLIVKWGITLDKNASVDKSIKFTIFNKNDGTEIDLPLHNPNKYEEEKNTNNYYLVYDHTGTGSYAYGTPKTSTSSNITDYIEVDENEKYYLSYDYTELKNTGARAYCFYDDNKQIIVPDFDTFYDVKNKITEITPLENAKYIRITLDQNISNVSFTKGLPFQHELTSNDTLNIGYDGNTHIEKKWGKLILNGSEGSWYLSGTHCKKNTFKDLGITNILTPATNSIVGNAICNTFTLTSATNIYNGNSIIGFGIGTDGLYFNYNDMTVNDFKAFLKSKYDAGTPVIVYYALATPQTIELENTQIPLLPDTNNISVESNVEPTETKVKYALDIFSEPIIAQTSLMSEVAENE